MKMWRLNRKGFTLVEIMIVVAIIGLLAAIAIPNFITARETARQNTCRANIRTMQGGLELAVFDGATAAGAKTAVELQAALVPNYIRTMPACASGGVYSSNANNVVSCSIHGTP